MVSASNLAADRVRPADGAVSTDGEPQHGSGLGGQLSQAGSLLRVFNCQIEPHHGRQPDESYHYTGPHLSEYDRTKWEAHYSVALPMMLIGAGQGLAFAPLTSFGLAGVRGEDAGAASGLVNTAHQLGMGTGLAILVAASAGAIDLTSRVASALTWGTGLLTLCLVVVLAVILPAQRRHGARPRRA